MVSEKIANLSSRNAMQVRILSAPFINIFDINNIVQFKK